jgi:putative DNA primase/helicase
VDRNEAALGFYVKKEGEKKSKFARSYPAMIAAVQGQDGHAVTIHRTYLEEGAKARIHESKKLLNGGINGAAIRLFQPTEELAIAEGIETALAVHLRTRQPVWAVISAPNMEKVWIPDTVRKICIYADNDSSFTGQAAAYSLAKRPKSQEKKTGARDVAVYVPRKVDTDWADVLLERLKAAA